MKVFLILYSVVQLIEDTTVYEKGFIGMTPAIGSVCSVFRGIHVHFKKLDIEIVITVAHEIGHFLA